MTAVNDQMAALHAEYADQLLYFLMGFTRGGRHSAEDMLQETMLRAWRHLDAIPDEPKNRRRWLFMVARRIAIDAARSRETRPVEVSMVDLGGLATGEDSTETAVATASLKTAFAGLSPAHRTILSEVYLRGNSMESTAYRLGVPLGTVKSRAFYGLRSLRAALNPPD